ncbi:MAG: hypothetical protein WCQ77_13165 [Planctomycetota bacterium]
MTLLIGTDEAGYGPNLGPLVVAATTWQIAVAPKDAETVLAHAMADVNTAVAATGSARPPLWADSKQIYRAGTGFDTLELGVSVGLQLASKTNTPPSHWLALAEGVGLISPRDGCQGQWQGLPCLQLPRAASADRCAALASPVREALARHGVTLVRIDCHCLYPGELNGLLGDGLNKSDILSAATLNLAAHARALAPHEPAIIWCDRHGGRKRYGGLVSRHFDAPLVQAREETSVRSVYNVPNRGPGTFDCRIEFCVGGESRAPVALASMTAKYIRELSMLAFNTFWSERVPGLESTAGYPVDALRWRHDAAAAVAREEIADDDLWRKA